MTVQTGSRFREDLEQKGIFPFIGVYDVFSASIASKYYDGIFISGFGFAASHYGLPDIGFIAWSDMVNFVQRVKTVIPNSYLLVDIDDGYVDSDVACHVLTMLESIGAAGVVIEDQKRPRRCGHFDGKQVISLDRFIEKLENVLAVRKELFVVARTDATQLDDIVKRAQAFARAGADAILADGLKELEVIRILSREVDKPLVFNQIAGGKSPACTLAELREAGVSIVNYSTPCLFAAQEGIDAQMKFLKENDGLLLKNQVGVPECTALLNENMIPRN